VGIAALHLESSKRYLELPGSHRKHVPLRTCIACHQQRPKRELMRIVRTPEGVIDIDPVGKRSGRGAYVCANLECWETALGQGKLGRALKCPVSDRDVAALREAVVSLLTEDPVSTVG
jgi:predicted RNA-binding protein YlxR (DUF448 family)